MVASCEGRLGQRIETPMQTITCRPGKGLSAGSSQDDGTHADPQPFASNDKPHCIHKVTSAQRDAHSTGDAFKPTDVQKRNCQDDVEGVT